MNDVTRTNNETSDFLESACCRLCVYGSFFTEYGGECRRNPPTLLKESSGQARWPRVSSDDWCGEWKLTGLKERERIRSIFGDE